MGMANTHEEAIMTERQYTATRVSARISVLHSSFALMNKMTNI